MKTIRPLMLAGCILLLAFVTTRATAVEFEAFLTGPGESPPNASPGTGFADVTFDLALHTLHVVVNFQNLTGTTTASHIHSPTAVPFTGTAGVATQTPTFANFPLGVTSGSYDMTFDTSLASTYNPAFVTANGGSVSASETALFNSINAGTAYLNIHTTIFQGGEIRGFLVRVPEKFSTLWAALPFAAFLLAPGIRRIRRYC